MSALADRYARAVFELGVETRQLSAVAEQLAALASAYRESSDLRGVLDNPLVPEAKRASLIDALGARLSLGKIAMNTVRLLMQRHRVGLLPDLAASLAKLVDEREGLLRATVVSAAPLSEAYCQRLTQELEKMTRRRVVLERSMDPTLISGVVTRIGDHTIDGSVKGRLEALKHQLLGA